ncbi:MAG: ABC transporter ATP-binding protein [Actinobacteria bacterium]|nr:ABC transporter ATP-binding protein [Actinomycetota bacterium]
MIKVADLKKNYGKVEALKSISFEVEKGSVFGFIGRNGAGKTTTMNILTGLMGFDKGKIFIMDRDFTKNKNELIKKIGYLPETPTFYNYMNAYEYMDFIGSIIGYGKGNIKKRTGELLEMVKLGKNGKRRIGGYSRGMKQRLALAVAILKDPEILFLDEPSSALDPEGRLEMLDLIDDLKDNKITIFLSTHILNDAERVCDTICIIDEGRILMTEKLSKLYEKYIQPVFDIEFEGIPKAEADILRKLDWVEDIVENGKKISLQVDDIKRAGKEILAELSRLDMNIVSYKIRKRTLEDIFIGMVNRREDI